MLPDWSEFCGCRAWLPGVVAGRDCAAMGIILRVNPLIESGVRQATSRGKGKSVSSQHFGRALLRVAGRKTGENRWIRAFYRGTSVTLASVRGVLHVLWLEVAGSLFLVLAVVGGGAAVREYHRYAHGTAGFGKVLLAAAFALAFLYFGVSSFTRSRRR
jgi:hypothetical protein